MRNNSLVFLTSASASSSATLSVSHSLANYDVAYVVVNNLVPSTDASIRWRITKSGTADTSSKYQNARRDMPANAAFQNNEAENGDYVENATVEADSNLGFNAVFWLYNFGNDNEYSYANWQHATWVTTPQAFGGNGGYIHNETSTSDGLSFYFSTGNIASGELAMYGVTS